MKVGSGSFDCQHNYVVGMYQYSECCSGGGRRGRVGLCSCGHGYNKIFSLPVAVEESAFVD